jgi:uncharacterized membrane protein YgcG
MRQFLSFLIIFVAYYFFLTIQVHASPQIDFPKYEVFITINSDSTVIVEEKITERFNGISNGVRRDLVLYDPQKNEICVQNNLSCGGFSNVILLGAYDGEGNFLDAEDGFKTYEVTETTGKKYFRFEWKIWDEEYQNDTEITWSIRYLLLGSINWLKSGGITLNETQDLVPYFYWNAIPETRAGNIEYAKVSIKFPDDVNYDKSRFKVFTNYGFKENFDREANILYLNLQKNLGSYGHFTIAYEFNQADIDKGANIKYSMKGPKLSGKVFVDDIEMMTGVKGEVKDIPSGKHKLLFQATGFKDNVLDLELNPGEVLDLEIDMQRTVFSSILFNVFRIMFVLGLVLTPLGIVFVFFYYKKNGRDKDKISTIIPEFSPPSGVPPYLVGALIDEKVDRRDIIGTIIDLAYKGYITIKEVKENNYELIRTEKDTNDLNKIEKDLLSIIFKQDKKVSSTALGSRFAQKYPRLVNSIHDEMVERGFFKVSPQKARTMAYIKGILILVASGIVLSVGSILISTIINYPILFSLALPFCLAGIGLIAIAKFMPAKTKLGSEVLAKIKGFRMYLVTAERYSLQNLKPEDFEKYLSYAIVFGVEKKWAEHFKNIYKSDPQWFDSSRGINDPLVFATAMRSFSNQLSIKAFSSISTSHAGGGWSGGSSSFGGFSGGGGGGGSAGGW